MSVLSVSDLVEQHVRTRPCATAVTYPSAAGGTVSLTYRELSSSANLLATHLRARGVRKGDRVVTALRPGPALAVALLAVVRAGAVHVPVDPAGPGGHRRLIVLDCEARAVVTRGAARGDYRGLDAVVVDLDVEAEEIAARPDTLPGATAGPDDACCVCYASGTTDVPRGVVVTHRAVLDFARAHHYLRLIPSDLVARLVGPAPAPDSAADADARIIEWNDVCEVLHDDAGPAGPGTGFAGRNGSDDALPMPPELREWQGAMVERIRELPRRRVLEIGVGAGLLLGHLAHDPECEEYWGTDPREQDIAALTARTQADPTLAKKLRLRCQGTEDTAGLPAGHFDAVVINAVGRHFPDLAHLRALIERALPLLAPGGALLLGDVPHPGLAGPDAGNPARETPPRRIGRQGERETGLLLSPALIDELARQLPAVHAVDVRTKRGIRHNDLTRYHYEAVLHTAEPVADLSGAPVLRWGQDVSSAAVATACLDAARPAALRLRAVPNLRVHDAFTALQGLGADPAHHLPVPDPEELCAAGERLGYLALPTWSAQGAGLLDIVYVDPDQVPAGPLTGVYAAPAAIVERPGAQPGTPIQEIVRDLFAEVLNVPRSQVHADSDFFGMGGRPSAAARLLSRVHATLDAAPGSRALHGAPTPAAFAALVGDGPAAVAGPVRAGTDSAVLPLRLRGTLNRRALDEALVDLGSRHEALRNSRIGSAGTRLRTLSADDHLLDLSLPATSVDLWSHMPLAAELARAYGARATGDLPHRSPAGLDAAPRALFGDTAPTELPGGSTPPAHASYGTVEIDLDGPLHTRLTEFAAAHGATVFMVAHAALATLLSRLGAADGTDGHVTVAAQVPARDSAGLRGAVGPYGRTLALSVDSSGGVTFEELLHRVRTSDLAAYRDGAHALALPGGVALAVLQEPAGGFEAAGLTVRPEHPFLPLPDADLGLTLTERQTSAGGCAGIRLCTSYRHETVGEEAASERAGQFVAVLEAALDNPSLIVAGPRPLPGSGASGTEVQPAEL